MDGREQQSRDEGEVIDEEAELHRVAGEPVGPVERNGQEQDVGDGDGRDLAEVEPREEPIASADSKKAATQARRCGNGKPAPAISAAVASMPMRANLNAADMPNTNAKISRATRIAIVFGTADDLFPRSDEAEGRALRIKAVEREFAAGDFHRPVENLSAAGLDRVDRAVDVVDPDVIGP